MSETAKGVLELLEQLRQERNELDTLIHGLEKRLGILSEPIEPEAGAMPAAPRVKVSIDSIPVGFFHNLSQAEAAEKLLRLHTHHPLTTQEILQTLRKAGMQMNPKNAVPILYTTLKRSPKFERVAGKKWGVSEWYPSSKKKKAETRTAEETSSE